MFGTVVDLQFVCNYSTRSQKSSGNPKMVEEPLRDLFLTRFVWPKEENY